MQHGLRAYLISLRLAEAPCLSSTLQLSHDLAYKNRVMNAREASRALAHAFESLLPHLPLTTQSYPQDPCSFTTDSLSPEQQTV
jgi:hypothetical protein